MIKEAAFAIFYLYYSVSRNKKHGKIPFKGVEVPVKQSVALEWKCFKVNHGCGAIPKLTVFS